MPKQAQAHFGISCVPPNPSPFPCAPPLCSLWVMHTYDNVCPTRPEGKVCHKQIMNRLQIADKAHSTAHNNQTKQLQQEAGAGAVAVAGRGRGCGGQARSARDKWPAMRAREICSLRLRSLTPALHTKLQAAERERERERDKERVNDNGINRGYRESINCNRCSCVLCSSELVLSRLIKEWSGMKSLY